MLDILTLDDLASKVLLTDKPKKEKEQSIIEGFLQTLCLGFYTVKPKESPDFIIQFSAQGKSLAVGCELTIFNSDETRGGPLERKLFAQWKRFARELRTDLDNLGGDFIYLYGAVHFVESDKTLFDNGNA